MAWPAGDSELFREKRTRAACKDQQKSPGSTEELGKKIKEMKLHVDTYKCKA